MRPQGHVQTPAYDHVEQSDSWQKYQISLQEQPTMERIVTRRSLIVTVFDADGIN